MKSRDTALAVTRASKSNLALAFVSLRGARRRDITTFYAFCRLIDDVADDAHLEVEEKRRALQSWRLSLRSPVAGEAAIAQPVRDLMSNYAITPEMLEEIIAGVEMDIDIKRYPTFEQLRVYCYRVASAVGLVSIEIFGYQNARCREYAVALGLALQVTNIIRDVAADLQLDRIYIPAEDFARFGYSEAELKRHAYDQRFIDLTKFEAARARQFFADAVRLLPPEDRRSMAPAEIMRCVYQKLLAQMSRDGFRLFAKSYRPSKATKLRCVAGQLLNMR